MVHAPHMAAAQNLLLGLMCAPLLAALAIVALGILRRGRPGRRALGDTLRAWRNRLRRRPGGGPLQIVERSAGGFVRVRPLPTAARPRDKA